MGETAIFQSLTVDTHRSRLPLSEATTVIRIRDLRKDWERGTSVPLLQKIARHFDS